MPFNIWLFCDFKFSSGSPLVFGQWWGQSQVTVTQWDSCSWQSWPTSSGTGGGWPCLCLCPSMSSSFMHGKRPRVEQQIKVNLTTRITDEWFHLQTLIALLTNKHNPFISSRWFHESSRWLVLNNNPDQAIKNLKSVAKFNGRREEGEKLNAEVRDHGVFVLFHRLTHNNNSFNLWSVFQQPKDNLDNSDTCKTRS